MGMEIAFNDNCCLCCLFFALFTVGHWFSCCKRQQVRAKYQLLGSGCEDCLACSFCPFLHYQQLIHEIEFREGKVIACCGDVTEAGGTTTTTTVTTTTTTEMAR